MARRVRFTEAELREAVASSTSVSGVLRHLGLRVAGGNHATVRKYLSLWSITTDHFDPYAYQRDGGGGTRDPQPLDRILVEHSTYSRGHLKRRLYRAGLKRPVCEQCGQGELWRGRRMAMILDHINGVADDHRLENLQIVCPNCAATLETHCGRQNRKERSCARCGETFLPRASRQRYCSRACGVHASPGHAPRPAARKVPRPPYAQLVREVHALGWCGVGRRHGVSDNAVRKWVRQYERERAAAAEATGADVTAGAGASPEGPGMP